MMRNCPDDMRKKRDENKKKADEPWTFERFERRRRGSVKGREGGSGCL